ncbi:MAG: acyltransferase family protein [Paludibacteraceae bacterium]
MATQSKRLLALDVLRGITIAGMIIVNNPGSWAHIYAPLRHAAWNGCTPTDLVFPFFMFVMGVAMFISYRKFDYRLTWRTFGKLLYRGALLVLIGWAINWFGIFCRTLSSGGSWADALWNNPIARLRFMGVLPRLGIVSFLGGLCLLAFKPKRAPWVAAVLLIVYCIIIGVTHSFELTADNIVARVDVAVLGDSHMYHMGGIAFDPEGLLSTIPCVAHVLLGVMAGSLIMPAEQKKAIDNWMKINRLFIFGSIILMAGFLLDYAFPINKSLWSASYVLVTCGLASLLLGLLIWVIDICGKRRWSVFFESFGANPLFIFVLSGILSITMANIKFGFHGDRYSVWGFWYKVCMQPLFGDKLGSLVCALSLIAVLWAIGHILYRKKIYIKL